MVPPRDRRRGRTSKRSEVPRLATVDGPILFRIVRPSLSITRSSKALVVTRSFDPCVKQEASKVQLDPSSSGARLGSVDDAVRVALFASSVEVRFVSF